MIFVDLLLLNGEIVRIECPKKFEDDLYDAIEHAMKRRDWWSRGMFEGCSMKYIGTIIDRVNMGQVVAML